jgi:hypothetical protein
MKKGNTTYYACKGLMTSKLINMHTERKIYITIYKMDSDLHIQNLDTVCIGHK